MDLDLIIVTLQTVLDSKTCCHSSCILVHLSEVVITYAYFINVTHLRCKNTGLWCQGKCVLLARAWDKAISSGIIQK